MREALPSLALVASVLDGVLPLSGVGTGTVQMLNVRPRTKSGGGIAFDSRIEEALAAKLNVFTVGVRP